MGRGIEFWTGIGVSDPRDVPESAKRLEADGWDGLSAFDSQCMFPDGWVFLTLAALATERVKLTPGVTNPITRHPSVTAAAAASLQIISAGRAVLGVGRGDSALAYIGASPMAISTFEHYLEVLQSYLRGEEVPLAVASAMVVNARPGFDNLAVGSAPHASSLKWLADYDMPKVPVEAYATGPKAIAAAARTAEAVVLGLTAEVHRVAWGVNLARTAATEAGRDDVRVGCVVIVIPHDDVQAARDMARAGVATTTRFSVMNRKVIGPATEKQRETMLKIAQVYDMNNHGGAGPQSLAVDDEFVDQYAIVGSADYCVDRLNELVALGVDRFNVGLSPSHTHSYDLLINDVLPRVRAASTHGEPLSRVGHTS